MTAEPLPVDHRERARALATGESSFLVQAPAGSGKTELLTQRMVKLLAEVDEPEEILAITFTIAATAEMRGRVLQALERARLSEPSADDSEMTQLARAALANDAARGWRLLEQPHRLSILTIDAVCLMIAHATPLLSRLGGSLSPTEKAQPLYDLAARRTLARLGNGGALANALRALLALRAVSLPGCEALIAGMLGKRDQWRRVMPLVEPVIWPDVRAKLERPLANLHAQTFDKALSLFTQDQPLAEELLDLLAHACGNLEEDSFLAGLTDVTSLEQLTTHDHWLCLCDFLLTKGHEFRAKPDKRQGFPAGNKAAKDRYAEMIAEMQANPALLAVLRELRDLPPSQYTEDEFALLQHLLLILRYATAELRLVFAEQSVIDFVELGLAARGVLTDDEGQAGELAALLGERWRHLLVDEFQDTSHSQYELLTLLVEGWESSRRGTCFLVGDPMQSIYAFRQAEVELFERTRRYGLGSGRTPLKLESLQLQMNFRSHAGLVDRLNEIFSKVFIEPAADEMDEYHVRFAPSHASDSTPRSRPAVTVWPQLLPSRSNPEPSRAEEAARVVSVIQEHLPALDAARTRGGNYSIAVLVRARSHLALIARRLREADIPFRAVEIEQLGTRQEVQDLTALTRALLHPMDRIAWLTVLRAPWCGLTLSDLHILCGNDDRSFAARPVLVLLRERTSLLSPDGQQRAARVQAVLEAALHGQQRSASLTHWVERTWTTLGGHACVDRAGYENVRAFFTMLEDLGTNPAGLEKRLETLYAAPDPRVDEHSGVQLMTIHQAKGLGFEVVIVPGLDRSTQGDDSPLLRWIEQTRLVGPEEQEDHGLVVAPIGANGKSNGIYKWIGQQKARRNDDETRRLLYVAATRAREELHLLGTATMKERDGGTEVTFRDRRSLLAIAWPAIAPDFERALAAQQQRQAETGEQTDLPFAPAGWTIPLRRLPAEWKPPVSTPLLLAPEPAMWVEKPRASLRTRAFGIVVHALMEDLAHGEGPAGVDGWRTRAVALLRAQGLTATEVDEGATAVMRALKAVLRDPVGDWILGARAGAKTEAAWSMWSETGGLSSLRSDRIFRAGAEPSSGGETHLWVVDYKTSQHGASGLEEFLAGEKDKYRQQLESYADVLRKLPGNNLPLRLALYFPLLTRLLWWAA